MRLRPGLLIAFLVLLPMAVAGQEEQQLIADVEPPIVNDIVVEGHQGKLDRGDAHRHGRHAQNVRRRAEQADDRSGGEEEQRA